MWLAVTQIMLKAGMGTTESKSVSININTTRPQGQNKQDNKAESANEIIKEVNDITDDSQDRFFYPEGVNDDEEVVDDSIDDTAMTIIRETTAEDIHSTSKPSQETVWEQAFNDAAEFENILFSIRRPSARHRLEKLVDALKIVGSKLKRREEVTTVLNKRSTIASDGTATTSSLWRKRTLSNTWGEDAATKESKKAPVEAQNQAVVIQDSVMSVDTSTSNEPPLLKPKDKFVVHLLDNGDLRCPNFYQCSNCPLGSDCNRIHIFNPLIQPIPITHPDYRPKLYVKADLEMVYMKYRATTITSDNLAEKIKPDASGKQRYTSRFTCPVEKTIYYTQAIPSLGFPSVKSSQGIYWFDSAKDSQISLCTLIIYSLQQRNIVPDTFSSSVTPPTKTKPVSSNERVTPITRVSHEATVSLPLIHPWNWMEINHEDRCTRFYSSQGCSDGKRCRFAHVHFPQSVTQDRAPSHKALPYAYLYNFGLTLTDTLWNDGSTHWMAPKDTRPTNFFRIRYASDDHKRTWYTAAWKCPREGIIYYAAGAKNGLVNNQNMFLYPTLEDAKLAVCGVILNAFANRGLWGNWDEPSSNRTTQGGDTRETKRPIHQQVQKRPKLSNENPGKNHLVTEVPKVSATETKSKAKPNAITQHQMYKPEQLAKKMDQKNEAGPISVGRNINQDVVNSFEQSNDEIYVQYRGASHDDEEGEIPEDHKNPSQFIGKRDSKTGQAHENGNKGEILEELFS